MTKNRFIQLTAIAFLSLAAASASHAKLTYQFFYNEDGNTPNSWGQLEVDVFDSSTLSIFYQGLNPFSPGSGSQQATGFGFNFDPDVASLAISNPLVGDFGDDNNDLDWIVLNNLNAFPNPTNSSSVTKSDFVFGATEGNANNINPPGIVDGDADRFFISGFSGLTSADLESSVELVGVRYQSVLNSINGGSLFLVGTPGEDPSGPGGDPNDPTVPVPGPLALIGLGGVLLAWTHRRRNREV